MNVSKADDPSSPTLFRRSSIPVGVSIIPPLSAKEKLAAVNNFHEHNKKKHVSSVPPSQVVLTPAQPVQGSNCAQVTGIWNPIMRAVYLMGNSGQSLTFLFPVLVASATYLLDISVSGGDQWAYCSAPGGHPQYGTLTLQSGHLLYPFILTGSCQFSIMVAPPGDTRTYSWTKTELTKVS